MTRQQILDMPNSPVADADVVVWPVPLERTVSFKPGARYAPELVLECCDQLEFFEDSIGWSPFEYLKLCVAPAAPFDEEESLQSAHQRITDLAGQFPDDGLLIALGGEHAITPSIVAARMPDPGHVVFIDAHGDFREQYHGTPYSHACPAWRLHEAGHEVTLIGVRSLFGPEFQAMSRSSRVHLFTDEQLQRDGAWESLGRHLSQIRGPMFLSVDMDGFDPALVPGVGTPQPGGLSWAQACFVADRLMSLSDVTIRGMDIVELVPDEQRVSDMVAAKLLMRCVSHWAAARGYSKRPKSGSQMVVELE